MCRRVTLIGNQLLLVENHKGLIDYNQKKIRLLVGGGWLEILGDELFLQALRPDELSVEGKIKNLVLETGL